MKLPRGVPWDRLVRVFEDLGYVVLRQKGSHIRMRHAGPPPHFVTVPCHRPMKTGTLHSLLSEVARQQCTTVEQLAAALK